MLKIDYLKMPENKKNLKCPFEMKPTCIVIHNTANNASAMSEVSYMIHNEKSTSYHYAVDENRAIQGLPLNRNGFHAGDGRNGNGNRNGIGIEICRSTLENQEIFLKAENNAAELVAMLLKQFGWGMDKVKKHQDFSGKYCPHKTLDLGWERFLKKVEIKRKELEKEKVSSWAQAEWEQATRDGIIDGKNPQGTVTREMTVVMMYRNNKLLK